MHSFLLGFFFEGGGGLFVGVLWVVFFSHLPCGNLKEFSAHVCFVCRS